MKIQRKILIAFLSVLFCLKSFGQDSTGIAKIYIYRGISFGTWFPDGKNKVLGHAGIFGFTFGIKYNVNSYAFNFDLIGLCFNNTTEPIIIKSGDSLLTRNDYGGANVTIDYGREFLSKDRFSFEGICGLGFGSISYYNPTAEIDIHKNSLILDPGLSVRYLIGKKLFLQFKAQYNIANYALKDNVSTSFKGNYLTTKLIFGARRNHA